MQDDDYMEAVECGTILANTPLSNYDNKTDNSFIWSKCNMWEEYGCKACIQKINIQNKYDCKACHMKDLSC